MHSAIAGIVSLLLIALLLYVGAYVAVALALVSFVGVWFVAGDPLAAVEIVTLAVTGSVRVYDLLSVPAFVLLSMIAGRAGFGTDLYDVANQLCRRLRAGLGVTTVAANAAFALAAGGSIASAAAITRLAVPEMIHFKYSKRFAGGVAAGASVLGMLMPPGALLIVYALVAGQSIGDVMLAALVPGLLLTAAYIGAIWLMTVVTPQFVGRGAFAKLPARPELPARELAVKAAPALLLIVIVLGGIGSGLLTATEAGIAGALAAYGLSLLRNPIGWAAFKPLLMESAYITANILFLVLAALMYSRMLGIAGVPLQIATWFDHSPLGLAAMMPVYVVLLLALSSIVDTAAVIAICVPLFLVAAQHLNMNLAWFGAVTVTGATIGLLMPPFGLSCFVVKRALDRRDLSLADIFAGALPFALVMLIVLMVLIAFPQISLMIL